MGLFYFGISLDLPWFFHHCFIVVYHGIYHHGIVLPTGKPYKKVVNPRVQPVDSPTQCQPRINKPWLINSGGIPPIVMIWYLNGTFPIKQPRGLLIQGWHYLMLLVGIASHSIFFGSVSIPAGFIPISKPNSFVKQHWVHFYWGHWTPAVEFLNLVETAERSWRSFIAWITSVIDAGVNHRWASD